LSVPSRGLDHILVQAHKFRRAPAAGRAFRYITTKRSK
jgi:hypothetical protein